LRDPPSDGFFISGVYLWGADWDKSNLELIDQAARTSSVALPIIRISFVSEKKQMNNQTNR